LSCNTRNFPSHFIISEGKDNGNTPGVYKLSNDPRITSIGNFLRKTSLDELPQLINVLKGEMSLVGPRPPIPYECELYDIWHRRRLLSVKPGITGLWQVTGRSSTTFDEMVRLDLKYVNEWSLWLDIKLLLKTPCVILTGKGGY
jgi:lipopolysaccharide/colanic/teichoic acid biosynthesis glycosyltransferase